MLGRKTTPKVRHGRVQKKHRTATTAPDAYALAASLQIIRHAPGPGHVHVVDEHDVRRFLGILPDWPALSAGVRAIVLGPGEGADGCYRSDGVIFISSWPAELVVEYRLHPFEDHREVLERIGVPYDIIAPLPVEATPSDPLGLLPPPSSREGYARCWFERHTARDFLLMHVLLHELGHHDDRNTRRHPRRIDNGGEEYAEAWALRREPALWSRYRAIFGPTARGRRG